MAKAGVQIPITGDASSAVRAFKATESAAHGLHGKFGSLIGVVGGLAAAFGGLYTIKKVANFLEDAATAAAEDAQAQEILHTAVKNVTKASDAQLDALDDWITKTQALTGFTEEELRPAMVKLTAATKNVGKAQDLLAVAMDVSTARGASLETVVLALEKAQNGQLTGLQRLGIATKDAAGETLSFDEILKNLTTTYGGAAAAAAETYAGKVERLKLQFGEMKETIGAAFLPALDSIATKLNEHMPTIEKYAGIFSEKLGAAFSWLVDQGIPKVVAGYEWLREQLADKTTIIGGIFDILKTVLDGLVAKFELVWPFIQELVQKFIDWIQSPTGTAVIGVVVETVKTVLTTMQTVFETVWPAVETAVRAVIDWIQSPSGTALIEGALALVSSAAELVRDVFEAVWPEIKTAAKTVIDWISGPEGSKLVENALAAIQSVLGLLREAWEAAWPAIQLALDNAGPLITGGLKFISDALWIIQQAADAAADAIELLLGKADDSRWWITGEEGRNRFLNSRAGLGGTQGNWTGYQRGGFVPGSGPVPIVAHGGEYVLTKGDTSLMKQLVASVGARGGGNTFIIHASGQAQGEAAADAFLRRVAAAGVQL